MELEIKVRGEAKSGKTRVAIAISQALRNFGAEVTLWDDEILPKDTWCPPFIPDGLKVAVKTEMVPRGLMMQSVHIKNYCDPHDDAYCPKTEDHKHRAEAHSVVGADGASDIVDVACTACGRNGSFALDGVEINW